MAKREVKIYMNRYALETAQDKKQAMERYEQEKILRSTLGAQAILTQTQINNYLNAPAESIAPLEYKHVHDVISYHGMSIVLNQKTIEGSFSDLPERPEAIEGFSKLSEENFFSAVRSQGPSSMVPWINANNVYLHYEAQDGFKIHQTTYELQEATRRIRDIDATGQVTGTGKVVAFDLETAGGIVKGPESRAQGHIHDFTFITQDVDSIDTRAVDEDLYNEKDPEVLRQHKEKQAAQAEELKQRDLELKQQGKKQVYTGILGSTAEENTEYEKIIDKYRKGQALTKEEHVTAERLMLVGNEATTFVDNPDEQAKGLFKYETFAGQQDIANRTVEDMERGAKRLRDIGIVQEEMRSRTLPGSVKDTSVLTSISAIDSGAVDSVKNLKVTATEAELLKGLRDVLVGGSDRQGITLLGQNIRSFDISRLNQLIKDPKLSENARSYIQSIVAEHRGWRAEFEQGQLPQLGLQLNYVLDTQPIVRQQLQDSGFYTDIDLRENSKLGLSKGQQEAVVRTIGRHHKTDFYAGRPAHMSTTDVEALLWMTKKIGLLDNQVVIDNELSDPNRVSGFSSDPAKPAQVFDGIATTLRSNVDNQIIAGNTIDVTANEGELFLATKYANPSEYNNVLLFMEDALTGEIRTNEGYRFWEGQKQVVHDTFGQFGFQAGVSYQITNITNFMGSDEFSSNIKKINPMLDVNELTAITFTPDTGPDIIPYRSHAPITIVGTQQDVQNIVNDVLKLYGTKQADGTITDENVSEKVKRDLGITKVERAADGSVSITRTQYDPNIIYQRSQQVAQEESAAREARAHDYKKDKRLLGFIDAKEQAITNLQQSSNYTREQAEQAFMQNVHNATQQVIDKLKNGEEVLDSDVKGTFFDYFGFKPDKQQVKTGLYSETLSKHLVRLGYVEQNKELFAHAIQLAERQGGEWSERAIATYKQLWEGFDDAIMRIEGEQPKSLGMRNTGQYNYQMANRFDINLKGFGNIREDRIMSIDMSAQNATLADRVMRQMGYDVNEIRKTSDESKSKILHELNEHLIRTRQVGARSHIIYSSNEQMLEDVASKITEQLDSTFQDPNVVSTTRHAPIRRRNVAISELQSTEEVNDITERFLERKYGNAFGGNARYNVVNQATNAIDVDALRSRLEGSFTGSKASRADALYDLFDKIHEMSVRSTRFYDAATDPSMANVFSVDLEGFEFFGEFTDVKDPTQAQVHEYLSVRVPELEHGFHIYPLSNKSGKELPNMLTKRLNLEGYFQDEFGLGTSIRNVNMDTVQRLQFYQGLLGHLESTGQISADYLPTIDPYVTFDKNVAADLEERLHQGLQGAHKEQTLKNLAYELFSGIASQQGPSKQIASDIRGFIQSYFTADEADELLKSFDTALKSVREVTLDAVNTKEPELADVENIVTDYLKDTGAAVVTHDQDRPITSLSENIHTAVDNLISGNIDQDRYQQLQEDLRKTEIGTSVADLIDNMSSLSAQEFQDYGTTENIANEVAESVDEIIRTSEKDYYAGAADIRPVRLGGHDFLVDTRKSDAETADALLTQYLGGAQQRYATEQAGDLDYEKSNLLAEFEKSGHGKYSTLEDAVAGLRHEQEARVSADIIRNSINEIFLSNVYGTDPDQLDRAIRRTSRTQKEINAIRTALDTIIQRNETLQDTGQVTLRINGQDVSFAPDEFENIFQTQQMSVKELQELEETLYKSGQIDVARAYRLKNDTAYDVITRIQEGLEARSRNAIYDFGLDDTDPLFRITNNINRNMYGYDRATRIDVLRNLSEILKNVQLPIQATDYQAYSDPELFKSGTAGVTQALINNMRQTRESDANKGRLTSTARYTVSGIAEHMGAGSLQEGIDILDRVASDLPTIQVTSKDYQANKDAAEKWANEVVDKILNVHVSDQEISKYGWSDDQTKVIQKIQEIKRRDMKAALTNIFGSIVNNGMDLGWNEDTGQVFARAGGDGGTWQELILPKEVWSDGAFQSRLGYHRISTPLEIAAISTRPGDIPEFRFMSQAGRILQEKTKYLSSRLREQMTPEDMMKELQYVLGSANKEIRQAPSSLNVRTQTRFNQALFSYENVINNLDLLDIQDEDLYQRKIDPATAPGGILDPKTGKYVLDYEDANAKILRKFQENLKFRRQNPELPDSKLPHPEIAWNPERPEMGLVNALQAKREAIVRAVSTKLGNKEWSELEPFLDWNIKKSGHLMGSFLTFGDFLEQFNQQKRRAQESINEAPHFNVQRAVEHIKYNETESVRVGRAITNSVMLNYTTQQLGVEAGTVDTTIQAKMIGMRSHDLSLVVNEGMRRMEDLAREAIDTYDIQWMQQNGLRYEELGIIGKNAAGEYEFKGIADPIRRFLSLMNTTEQGAYMTQEMFDYAFNYRQSMQRIGIEKVVEDPQTVRDVIQENVGLRHTMSFDSQGNVSFKYGEGRFIEKGDTIARLKGMSAGETVPKKANYTGMLNFGFFHNDGTLVTEETIEARLNSAEAKAKLSKATDEVERRAIAINMLANDYRAMFYIEDVNANPSVKMADYAEKQMTTAIITDTGAIDKRIGQVMADLGFRFERSYVSMLDIKTIESLQGATDISQTRFGILANGLRESQRRYEEGLRAVNPNYVGSSSGQLTQLTSQEFMDVLNARGFSNADDFYNALMKERHQATDVLYEVFRTMGILDPGEKFQGINEQGSTVAKHGDVTDARKIANQLLARGKSIDEIADLFSKHLIPEGQIEKTDWNQILRRGADQLIVNKALAIDISEDVAERIFRDAGIPDWSPVQHLRIDLPQHNVEGLTGNVTDAQGNVVPGQQDIVYTKSFNEISQVGGHHDLQTLDKVKWDNRVISINENIRADKSIKEEARAYLTKYDPDHPERGEALYNRYIAPLKEGDVVLPGLTEQINRASLHRQGSENSLVLMDWTKNAAGENVVEINQQAVDELVQRKGLNRDVTVALLESFRDGSLHATTVSEEGFMAQYTAWASREANAFNYGERSVEEMKKLGFEVKTLDEILADSRSAGFENSIFGKNILLDIGSGSRYGTAGTFQAKGAQPNFLAISMNPVDLDINPDAMFDEHIASGPQKKVDTLLSALEDYHAAIRGENAEGRPLSQDERVQAASQLSRKIEDINDATWQAWASKKGQLASSARGHMYDSARFTSHGFDFTGLEDLGRENLADKLREVQADTTLTDVEKGKRTAYWTNMFQAAGKLHNKGGSGYALSDLTLSGINLVENASHANPINFNVQIQSLERMHEVYGRQIDNLFSSQLGLSDSVKNEIRDALYNRVQTQGVSGYVLRQPGYYEGSIQAAQIYFSDAVTGNNALSMTTRIGMRKEDFDSDAVESSLHKERARITVGGKTINADIDSAMFETLKSMGSNHGITVELLGNGQRNFDNLMAQQFLIGASTSNRYKYVQDWMNTYDALLMDFQKSTAKNSNIMTTQFDGNSVSGAKANTKIAIGNITGYTEQERKQLENQYYQFMSDIYHSNHGATFAKLKDVQEQRNFAFDVIRADHTNAATGEVDLQAVMNDNRFRALHFVSKAEQIGTDLVSQSAKLGAGVVNYNSQQYIRILQDAFANGIKDGVVTPDNMDGTMRRAQVINTALIEGNLTPKNVAGQALTDEALILKNQEMGKVFQEAFEAARTGMNRQEAEENLYNFLTTNYLGTKPQPGQPDTNLGRRDNELARLFTDLTKADGIKRTATYEEGAQLMREYAHNVVNLDWSENARALRVMRQGTTNAEFVPERQVGAASPLGNMPGSSLNIQQHNTAFVDATEKVLGRQASAQFSSPTFSKSQVNLAALTTQAANNLQQYGQSLSNAANISQIGKSTGLIESLLQGSGSLAKGLHGSGALFAGAIGGLMVAGFANDPTGGTMKQRRKRQEQAGGPAPVWGNGQRPPSAGQNVNGMADGMSLQQQRAPMPLSDSNLNVLRGMPQQSYVVNISGSSPRGQRAAMDAINNAGHAAMPQQTSINMNVSTTYSDKMSQYQVDRMVQTSLGF